MKKSLKILQLNKRAISHLSKPETGEILGGNTNTCPNYSCSCETVDPDLTGNCNKK